MCTGNRFRSPMAAALLRQFAPEVPLELSSRGMLDLGSVPVLPEALDEGARLGLDLSGHRTRPLVPGELTDTELVVGFERRHVAAAVVDGKARRTRAFTLPELVALLDHIERPTTSVPLDRARETLALLERERPHGTGVSVAELADPLGRSAAVYGETADRLHALTRALADGFFGRER